LDYFVKEANLKLNKKIGSASEETINTLTEYNWPGNVREPENTITNMCINTHGNIIRSDSIPNYIKTNKLEVSDKESFDRFLTLYYEKSKGKAVLPALISDIEKYMINEVLAKLEEFSKNLKYQFSIEYELCLT